MSEYVGSRPWVAAYPQDDPNNPLAGYHPILDRLRTLTADLGNPQHPVNQAQGDPWRYANNPVGTETTQQATVPAPAFDPLAFFRRGQPVTETQAAHDVIDPRTGRFTERGEEMAALPMTMTMGMIGDAPGGRGARLMPVEANALEGLPRTAGPSEAAAMGDKWYHGTSRGPLPAFDTPEVYLTSDPGQAAQYAADVHRLGAAPGTPHVHDVTPKPGAVRNIDDALFEAMDTGDELHEVIDRAAAQARKDGGVRYLEYTHPNAGDQGEHTVRVSLYPKEDLALGGAPAPAPNELAAAPAPVIRAYHGSPHEFPPTPDNPLGAFDLSKIGTGEGAQAYGHGLYTAGNEHVARQYRDALADHAPSVDFGSQGPGKVSVAHAVGVVRDHLLKHPELQHVDNQTIARVADFVGRNLVDGMTPSEIREEARHVTNARLSMLRGDGAQDAIHEALAFLSDAKVDPGGPKVGGKPYNHEDPVHRAAFYVERHGSVEAAQAKLKDELVYMDEQLRRRPTQPGPYVEGKQRIAAIQQALAEHGADLPAYEAPGHMYEVEIAAHPEHLLDWDKPWAEQSAHVQSKLTEAGLAPHYTVRPSATGKTWEVLYKNSHVPNQAKSFYKTEAAAQADAERFQAATKGSDYAPVYSDQAAQLREAGIPGVRYADAGSRGKGEGTHNYVVFDPKIMNIVRRYGIAGLIAAGAGTPLAKQGDQ